MAFASDPTFSVSSPLPETCCAVLSCGILRYHRVQDLVKIWLGRDSNPCALKTALTEKPNTDAACYSTTPRKRAGWRCCSGCVYSRMPGYTDSSIRNWRIDIMWHRHISQPSGALAPNPCFRQVHCQKMLNRCQPLVIIPACAKRFTSPTLDLGRRLSYPLFALFSYLFHIGWDMLLPDNPNITSYKAEDVRIQARPPNSRHGKHRGWDYIRPNWMGRR